MKLGDLFPDELKENNANYNLQKGSVIKMHVDDTTPPKVKRFIIIGITKDEVTLGAVYINSEINPNIFRNKSLRDLHLPLVAEGNDFLDHDSFVDCSKIFPKSTEVLKNFLIENTDPNQGAIGKVEESDLGQIQAKLLKAMTISYADKKRFGIIKETPPSNV